MHSLKSNCNHKILLSLIVASLCSFNSTIFAEENPLETISTINGKIEYNKVYAENLNEMTLDLGDKDKLELRKEAPTAEMDGTIKLTPEETELKDALQFQKGKDVEDIKMLWAATVERNQVIRFALEKIAAPPQQRNNKSSLMARSIATMLQGAAIVPSLFGMGMASEYGSAFGGQLISNAFSKKFLPAPGMPSITEPELIQLTGLIEDLQEQLINSYYNYKSSLESLMLEKKNTELQEVNYKKAIESKDPTAIIISSALHDKAKQSEIRLKQQVKLHRIQLERMAGIDAVSALNLSLSDKVMQAKFNLERSRQEKSILNEPLQSISDDKKKKKKKSKKDKTDQTAPENTSDTGQLNNPMQSGDFDDLMTGIKKDTAKPAPEDHFEKPIQGEPPNANQ